MATELKEVFVKAEPVTEHMHLNVLCERQVWVDGSLWSFGKHRYAIECGTDLAAFSKATGMPDNILKAVKAYATPLWTAAVKRAWAEHKATQGAG